MAAKKLYLYLAKRDKKGFNLLSVFHHGYDFPATRVQDVSSLSLPAHLQTRISKTKHDERMLWELWIEGAESFEDLKQSLKDRGYSNIPVHSSPKHESQETTTRKKGEIKKASPMPKTKILNKSSVKTMLRKKKS